MSKLEVTLALAVLILIGLLGFGWYEQRQGAQACLQADAAAVAKQIAKNTQTTIADTQEVLREKAKFAADQLQPVDVPAVSLCRYALQGSPVPAAGPAGPAVDGGSAGPEANLRHALPGSGGPGGVLQSGPDIAKPLVTIGRDSDAQLVGLQAYIKNVCQAQR